MRILLRVDGSHRRGLGHVTRCVALGRALEARGHHVEVVSLEDPVGLAQLRSAGWTLHTAAQQQLPRLTALRAAGMDVVVQDILATQVEDVALLRGAFGGRLVHLDDLGPGAALCTALVQPLAWMWEPPASAVVLPASTVVHSGPAFMILGPRVLELARHAPTPTHPPRVLLAFGGTDDHHLTERVLEALNAVDGPLDLRVNLGPGSAPWPDLAARVQRSPHQPILTRPSADLPALMHGCTLAVCAGGVMLFELAALGVPAVALAGEPHERRVIAHAAAAGVCVDGGAHEDLHGPTLASLVQALLQDPRRRQDMASAGRALLDGQGLSRVVDVVEGRAPTLPHSPSAA